MSTEDRIIELETRIAYQDRTIAELDEVVRAFADRVIALERQVRELRDSLSPDGDGERGDEPPPHY